MAKKVEMVIIDPQKDFCDPKGALFVPGADADMKRLADFIKRVGSQLSNIHVTLDSHHLLDVAHPIFWRDSDKNNPDPFTIITAQDVKDGKWLPVFANYTKRMIEYVEGLEASGRYPLCIWPPHCLIGTEGAAVMPVLNDALQEWAASKPYLINFVSKGSNIFTEHYSAVKAEVPDAGDPTTQLNTRLINTLMEADTVIIAGEAGSHCVANTVRDIADGFGNDDAVKKLVLLTDAVSPVVSPFVDFPKVQQDFIDEMIGRGMQTSTTVDFMATVTA